LTGTGDDTEPVLRDGAQMVGLTCAGSVDWSVLVARR
jgi:hypothetical protein